LPLWLFLALGVNVTCGYWIARSLGRGKLGRWLERRGRSLPTPHPGHETRWILLVRVTPGIPLFVQNYALGMAGVNFPRYLLLSFPVQIFYAVLFITLGNSLSGSHLWRAILAGLGLVAAGLLVSLVRAKVSATSGSLVCS
jgi:uncharacterized membrane protein YdjX (TVP38/TMEM64 family)